MVKENGGGKLPPLQIPDDLEFHFCHKCKDTGVLDTMYYGDHPVNRYCECEAGRIKFEEALNRNIKEAGLK